MDFLEIN
jgi:acetyl-CoA C-acetyltransferase